ncbi:hypothetical protein [Planctomicrobium sp. SH664]|uniref:hypothetical protein n=1 Tax=Planctomicrobium sp. SH664 TaxID=3448125 RepID=UPI003F5C1044
MFSSKLLPCLFSKDGQQVQQPYSHRNSLQPFTQAQLISCLILRASLKTTYRVIEFRTRAILA